MADLISVNDCPCDGCKAKPCGHPARCVKFTLWLNKTVDAVSREVFEQFKWERDVALKQLEDYGISLGEIADAVKAVRCKNCQSHEPCEVRNRVWCSKMGRYMKEDGFCSEGKVKE